MSSQVKAPMHILGLILCLLALPPVRGYMPGRSAGFRPLSLLRARDFSPPSEGSAPPDAVTNEFGG